MSILSKFFFTILYQPLFNLLVLLCNYLPGHDFGIVVIILTVLIKFLLYPFGAKAIKYQKTFSQLQPKVKEIQEKYKNNKEEQTKALLELYKKEGVNPFSGLVPTLVQFPVLIALYWVFLAFREGFSPQELAALYPFMPQPIVNTRFLGLMDMIQPSLYLAFLSGILQFIQTKIILVKNKPAKNKSGFDFSSQMQYFFPVMTVVILLKLPAAVALYWTVSSLFAIIQQHSMSKKQKNV